MMRRVLAAILAMALLVSAVPTALSEAVVAEEALNAVLMDEMAENEEVTGLAVLPSEAATAATDGETAPAADDTAEPVMLRVSVKEELRSGDEETQVLLRARVNAEADVQYVWQYRNEADWLSAKEKDPAADEEAFWRDAEDETVAVLNISDCFGDACTENSYRCRVSDGVNEAVSNAVKPVGVQDELSGDVAAGSGDGSAEANDTPAAMGEADLDAAADVAQNVQSLQLGVKEKFRLDVALSGEGTVTFASENAKVASVDQQGVVTAKAVGETKITVRRGNEVTEYRVTVAKAPAKVQLSAAKLSLGAGQSAALGAKPNSGSAGAITFSSSKASVATVDENGVITAIAKGTAKITAKAYNGKKAVCTVTVLAAPESVKLNRTEIALPEGMEFSLVPSVNKGAAADYRYSTTDESIAAVDAEGKIRAFGPGKAVITVTTYNGLTAECTVSVTAAPTEIRLDAENLQLGLKETYRLIPGNDQDCDAGYRFTSANAKVASVDDTGLITAKKAGTTEITATAYNGLTATCIVRVGKAPAKISLSAKSLSMGEGQIEQLEYQLSGGTGAVRFTSSNAGVAAVDENGVVTAVSKGKATISVQTYNGKKATCSVTVLSAPESLILAQTSASLPVGTTIDLKPSVEKGAMANYRCTSSDETVAAVNDDGVVTGVGLGTATITVFTYNGLSAACEITVTPAPARLEIDASEITLGVKESFRISASTDFGGDAGIGFRSSKSNIASVSADGKITAKKAGTAVITVSTFNGLTAECVVTVKKAPSSISLSARKMELVAGQREKLAYKLPGGSAGEVRFFSSSDCVTVDDNGNVQALSVGEAKITAKTYNGKTAVCTVRVVAAENSISDLWIERVSSGQNFAEATVSTLDACTLHVEVLSDDGQETVLMRSAVDVSEGLREETVRAELKALPEFFVLRAVLKDEDGKKISGEFISRRYTKGYQRFESQKPSDFPKERVLDFGSAGYGVLQDGVVRINAPVTENKGNFTFATDAVPAPGSVLLLNNTPVKVKTAVDNGNGTVTVAQDTNVYLADIYKVFKVDTAVDLGAASGVQARKPQTGEGGVELFRVQEGISFGPEYGRVSVNADVGIGLDVSMVYDEENLGEDYFEYECKVHTDGTLSAGLTGKLEVKDQDDDPPEIQLYHNDDIPIGTTGLFAELKVSVPVEITFDASGTASVSFMAETGFKYNPKDGTQKIEGKDGKSEIKIKGGFSVKTGPKIELGVTLGKILDAKASGWAGLEISGTAEKSLYDSSAATAKELHACELCVDINGYFFADFEGKLSYEINKWLKDDLLTIRLFSGRWSWNLVKSFYSVINEPESIYKGEDTWGLGKCKNKKYRVDFKTVDLEEREVNVPVTVSGIKIKTETRTSPFFLQVYDGDYSASAKFKTSVCDEAFCVNGKPMTVVLEEPGVEIDGYVSDEETQKGIKGAKVIMTAANGESLSAYTDEKGYFKFDRQPAGVYSFRFTAKGYKAFSLVDQEYKVGDEQTMIVSMEPNQLPKIHAMLKDKGTQQAITDNGIMPGAVPEVTLKYTKDKWNQATVYIYHEDCAKPYIYKGGMYTGEANLYGVDMGDGDYTYVLTAYNFMRFNGSGEDIFFLKVENGKFKEIKAFDTMERADGIYLSEGTFVSGSKLNGKIEPSGRKFTLTTKDSKSARKGKVLWYGSHRGEFILEENDEGYYNLIFKTQECCIDADDYIGGVCTRYVMKDGKLVIDGQWFEAENGKVVHK